MSLGISATYEISDEDLGLFDWVGGALLGIDAIPVSFIDRAHRLGVKVVGDIHGLYEKYGFDETCRRMRLGIENGVDVVYYDHFFGIPSSILNELFSYAKSVKPDILCGAAETTLCTYATADQYREYLAGGKIDIILTMAYVDLQRNRRSIDLLAALKREFKIPYAFAWVNLTAKGSPNYDWINNGMPTAEYALQKVDGAWFWCYIPGGCPADWGPGYDCICNFSNVRNWIKGTPEYQVCPGYAPSPPPPSAYCPRPSLVTPVLTSLLVVAATSVPLLLVTIKTRKPKKKEK